MEPARRIEELVVCQLACRLQDLVEKMAETPRVRRYGKLRQQILDSSESVPSNIAEGIGRFYPGKTRTSFGSRRHR